MLFEVYINVGIQNENKCNIGLLTAPPCCNTDHIMLHRGTDCASTLDAIIGNTDALQM